MSAKRVSRLEMPAVSLFRARVASILLIRSSGELYTLEHGLSVRTYP